MPDIQNRKWFSDDYSEDCIIKLRNIVKSYKSDSGEFLALKNVSLDINKGEFIAIVGKSGSGKSTLLNMLSGIDRPTTGEIFFKEEALHLKSEAYITSWRGKNLGIVFQFFQLIPTLTIIENVMLPMDFCNSYSNSKRREKAKELLERFEVSDHAGKLPTALSGGQQQRVAIARSLANDPPIIIADEPTGNLDSRTADAIINIFEELVSEGKTIIMVTHSRELAERAKRIITISDGEITKEVSAV